MSQGGAVRREMIPICYFPSTVLFIDDSRDFLLNFVLQLDENLSYKIVDSPFDALDIMQFQKGELEQLGNRCVSEYTEAENDPLTNQTVNIDLSMIHDEVYNPQRFSEISVIVIDYAMPGMNGLEFCERINSSRAKKILLTGQADEKIAIQAFNDGLIDKYIKKSSPKVTEEITDAINELQQVYFSDISDLISKILEMHSPSCLKDKVFGGFFRQLIQQHNIVEYYLMDNSGSFLLIDQDAKVSSLTVKTEQDLKTHYDLALDNGASSEVLSALKEGSKIPIYTAENHIWDDWSTYLLTAEQIIGKQTYYYALSTEKVLFDVRYDKIRSYDSFLNEVDISEMLV